jgi:hypothetical protein
MECEKCVKLTNELKGLRMQNGKLKKQLEKGDRKSIPDLKPYISKVDRLKNLADNIGDSELLDALNAELNNFKTLFKQLIRDVATEEPK